MNQPIKFVCFHQNTLLKLRSASAILCQYTKFSSSSSSPSTLPSASEKNTDHQLQVQNNSPKNEVAKVRYMPQRKTEILRMEPSEYADTGVGKEQLPFLERRGEGQSVWKHIMPDRKHNHIDMMALLQADIDLRPIAFKRLWKRIEAEHELRNQAYNPKRNKILGNDLAAAHFLLYRKGKVKFLHQSDWVTTYRTDAKGDEDERDLKPIRFELCTIPTTYNPNYRVDAIDATGVSILYEGLANFDGLHHVSWASFRNADKRFDDWCLDKIFNMFNHSLEYLDLSECRGISERGIAAAWKLKYLKTLVVENLPHIKNLEIVCAALEEKIPGLTCIGIDYEKKIQELKKENEEIERLELEKQAALEANTINVTPNEDTKEFISNASTGTEENMRSKI